MLKNKYEFGFINYIFNNLVNYKKENKRLLLQYVYSALRCWIDKKNNGKFKDNDMKSNGIIKLSFNDLHKKFIYRIKKMQSESLKTGKQRFDNEMFDYLINIKITLFRNMINKLKELHLISVKSDKVNGNEYRLNNITNIFKALNEEGYIIQSEILDALKIEPIIAPETPIEDDNVDNETYKEIINKISDKQLEKTYKKTENVQTKLCPSSLINQLLSEIKKLPKYLISDSISSISLYNTSESLDVNLVEGKKSALLDSFKDACNYFREDMKAKYNTTIRLSKQLKKIVLNKIENNFYEIDLKGSTEYIYAIICDQYYKLQNKRLDRQKIYFTNKTIKAKGNSEQRNYDFNEFERELLGWNN